MKAIIAFTVVAAVLILVGQAAMGQDIADRPFMVKAAQGGMAEVELGQLAAQQAQSEGVRSFGKRMMTDHALANNQLRRLAEQKAVQLPTTLDPKDRATKDQLSALSGPAFDRAYMNEMVKDHTMDVAEFEREVREGRDAEVRAWAEQTLPTLREHLRLAQTINTTIAQAPAGMAAASPAGVSAVVTAPWCGGAYLPTQGTNFAGCLR